MHCCNLISQPGHGPTYLAGHGVDRASFSQASCHTRLMHSTAYIALYAYKRKNSSICTLPVSRELLSCGHTFVRLLSIGKIVRSNCQRSTTKRRTTPDRRGVSRLCACSGKTRVRDRLHAHESWCLACFHAISLERSRFRKNAQFKSNNLATLRRFVAVIVRSAPCAARSQGDRQTDRQTDKPSTVTLAAHARRGLIMSGKPLLPIAI